MNSSLTKSTVIRLSWWKYLSNITIFQIPFSQWIGSLTKKLFWAFFQNTTKTICLQNFNVVSHPVQVFCWWMIHLWQIFGGNIFLVIFLRFCTSQKWNYQIWIKIEQDLGHYFSKFLKSLIVLYSCIVQWVPPFSSENSFETLHFTKSKILSGLIPETNHNIPIITIEI